MSGVLLAAVPTAEIALTATTTRTVLQLVAAAQHRVKVSGWGIAFDGTSTTAEPVQVEVVRQTSAGTMTALTIVKINESDAETIQTTAQHSATSTEPTTTDIIDAMEVHPQQGFEKLLPLGQEFIIKGGNRLAIRCTAPANVNCRPKFFLEE